MLAVLAAALLGAAVWAPEEAPVPPDAQYRLVSSAVLVCPPSSGAGDAASVLGALVTGPAFGPGSAAVRRIEAEADLVRLDGVGRPVALTSVGVSQPPLLVQADGSWAPSALAGVVSRQPTGTAQGLSSAACPVPGPDWWFVGGGSQIGRGAALLVSNPAEEPARFDISLYSGAGPIQALAGKGIDLGPAASVRLRLDALAPDEDLLAIEVRATSGRVAAALRDVAVPNQDRARGVDNIPPAQAPGTRLVIAGVPAGEGRRDLVLVNPGSQFATVTPRLLTEDGPQELGGLATIAVPAGAVIQVDLARVLAGRTGSLDLVSDVPITGGARAEWGTATRDVVWSAAVPLIGGPDPLGGAAAVPSGPGLVTSVAIAAPEGAVRGTLSAITLPVASPAVAALSGEPGAPPDQADLAVVLSQESALTFSDVVDVPAGSQRVITLPADDAGRGGVGASAGLRTLWWRSAEGSGPAAVTHLVVDPQLPLATGYPWWPLASSVLEVQVREDLGVLAPTG